MKIRSVVVPLLFITLTICAQEVKVSSGKVVRHKDFASKYVAARNVDVWLPQNYSADKKYAVLYMHDGQMLFDSTTTWNHQEWQVDEVVSGLLAEKKIRDCIVVGIWNTVAGRHADYFPQKPFEGLPQKVQDSIYQASTRGGQSLFNFDKIHSDNYLKFLVTELKPFIDHNYSSYTDAANTFVAGSSMGGLISMYALCEYPNVFGGAGCLSTHWLGVFATENNPIPQQFLQYLKKKLPNPKTHKIYFDYGSETLDASYAPFQKQADKVMSEKGYSDKNWQTKFFKGADHSEKAWAARLATPLIFLLGK